MPHILMGSLTFLNLELTDKFGASRPGVVKMIKSELRAH